MGAGELHQGEPVAGFLAPACPQRAALEQPVEGSLDHPASRGKAGFPWHVASGCGRFPPPSPMVAVRRIARTQDKRMHIRVVIAAISTEMLLLGRALGRDGTHHLAHHRFVGLIGRRDLDRDGCATLINQQVDFRARTGAVGRVLAGGLTAQGSRARATINRVPAPRDGDASDGKSAAALP